MVRFKLHFRKEKILVFNGLGLINEALKSLCPDVLINYRGDEPPYSAFVLTITEDILLPLVPILDRLHEKHNLTLIACNIFPDFTSPEDKEEAEYIIMYLKAYIQDLTQS